MDKSGNGALIVAGFNDGVVRLLVLGRASKTNMYGRKEKSGPGDLYLINAVKPHSARVTCLAVDRACQLLASAVCKLELRRVLEYYSGSNYSSTQNFPFSVNISTSGHNLFSARVSRP